jgi:hypothetical protein
VDGDEDDRVETLLAELRDRRVVQRTGNRAGTADERLRDIEGQQFVFVQVGWAGTRALSSTIKQQVWLAAAQRKLRPAHDRRYRDVCARRSTLRVVAGSQLSPELDYLFLKVDHSLGAHGCQSNEFHDYRPYPAVAGKGFVELGEPLEEFPSDNGFGIELYPPHFAERREVGCFFGMGLHLSSVGRLPRPVGRKNLSLAAVAVERLDGDQNL